MPMMKIRQALVCSGRIETTVESERRVSGWVGTRRMVFLMRTGSGAGCPKRFVASPRLELLRLDWIKL